MLNFKPKPVVPHKVTFFHTITLCGEVRTVRFQDPIQFKHVCMLLHCGIPPSALGDEFNICLEQWILVEKIWALLGSSSPFMQVEKMMQLTNLVC